MTLHPDMPVGQHCQSGKCGPKQHVATVLWDNGLGALVITRSYMGAWWCECCSVAAQLEFARERAKVIEELEAKLKQLTDPTSASGCV